MERLAYLNYTNFAQRQEIKPCELTRDAKFALSYYPVVVNFETPRVKNAAVLFRVYAFGGDFFMRVIIGMYHDVIQLGLPPI